MKFSKVFCAFSPHFPEIAARRNFIIKVSRTGKAWMDTNQRGSRSRLSLMRSIHCTYVLRLGGDPSCHASVSSANFDSPPDLEEVTRIFPDFMEFIALPLWNPSIFSFFAKGVISCFLFGHISSRWVVGELTSMQVLEQQGTPGPCNSS